MLRLALCMLLCACGSPSTTDTLDTDPGVHSDDTDDAHDTEHTDDTDHTDAVVTPDCTLGTGEDAFEPWPASGELPVIRGPQGGWHVLGSVQCVGIAPGSDRDVLDPANPLVSWTLDDEAGNVGGYSDLRRPMRREDGTGLYGELLIVWTSTYEEAIDRDVTMTFTLEDRHGTAITRTRLVRLVSSDPPVDTDTDTVTDTL